MKVLLTLLIVCISNLTISQNNITVTEAIAGQVLKGSYDPGLFSLSTGISHPDTISQGVLQHVSPDSLKEYIIKLASFRTRNTGSDTISTTEGIGAARSWIYQKFSEFSAASGNRLIPAYLQFDMNICDVSRHKNTMAVLPGADTANHKVILIEGHMDSRCAGLCDTACVAEGVEDNASGTALVMELARVLSRYQFDHTIVFMTTTAEEQGLSGAEAFASYAADENIPLVAVFNNDVVGGILCGQTASPPGCPGLNHIDSTQVRLFSQGGYNSPHKQLARYIKLQYQERLHQLVSVPMQLTIMSAEDRTGRGGDHIPFRQKGFPAMRFTSANEHGDASNGPGYTDRQHTHNDILGLDTNGDQMIDSFFVDFNYLARNAVINGNAAGLIAVSPETPDLTVTGGGLQLVVDLVPSVPAPAYRIALRSNSNDWDTLYTTTSLHNELYVPGPDVYFVSAAAVDSNGIESLFSREYLKTFSTAVDEGRLTSGRIQLLQNRPNPFDESTIISVLADAAMQGTKAVIIITDTRGIEISRSELILQEGVNELLYEHGYGATGIYLYHLYVGDKKVSSRRMVFAN